MAKAKPSAESERLSQTRNGVAWRRWGPYLSERAWGTVREDYSADGNAWDSFSHDQARSRAYRWSEDGIAGISDDQQLLCFAPTFWNGRDGILKERMFGLTNHEGNHGEDVKEIYFYLDNTPTHSYMKMLYRYPIAEFPYRQLVEINQRRTAEQPEYEILDTGVFGNNQFFDIVVEYAKKGPEEILCRITVTNRSEDTHATLHVLPTLWFRNTWAWTEPREREPMIRRIDHEKNASLLAGHESLGHRRLYARQPVETLFTFNDTNRQRLYGVANERPAVKDAFNQFLVEKRPDALHALNFGTKAAFHYMLPMDPGGVKVIELVLTDQELDDPFNDFAETFDRRLAEADEFYGQIDALHPDEEVNRVTRQALSGLLWSKQFYNYEVARWLLGDAIAPPPRERLKGRNADWKGFIARNVIVMPDTWEYPWFAAWDWAFHNLTLAYVDIDFAKQQTELMISDRFLNLSGQIPAYEWAFSDVNPPVQALAAWRIYNMEKRRANGVGDKAFLERVFHKLLINFVWWVNKKDARGNNVFEGGFLGLDNISVFDRSQPLPSGGFLEQADGTGWMGLFCLNMMTIALELAQGDPVYENMASKFLDHFMAISAAINASDERPTSLWDDVDGFYYDTIRDLGSLEPRSVPLALRTIAGLVPLFAVQVLERSWFEHLPNFKNRYDWYMNNREDLCGGLGMVWTADGRKCLLSIANQTRVARVMKRVMDEAEFLSPHGIRSLSKFHQDHPYVIDYKGGQWVVRYEPAESRSSIFGGNSNWRGPVWFPLNYLLVTALRSYHRFYGDDLRVQLNSHSVNMLDASEEISRRLVAIFLPGKDGARPLFGGQQVFRDNPHWQNLLWFNEYFNGDDGAGLGASHQTGWTALVVQLVDYLARTTRKTGG